MSIEKTVSVGLGDRTYDIHIGRDILSAAGNHLPFSIDGRRVFVLTDENVLEPHARTVCAALEKTAAASVSCLALPPGESTKSFAALERVLAWILDQGGTRQSVLFAVGGGVIGDLGGFAAAIMMRGIPFVQVPTTLLAMVDSAVGGKTAIDVPQGKNLVGAFYQPAGVLCDLDVLNTLPAREMRAGYAETVKYGLINDPEFFLWLENGGGKSVLNKEPDALIKAVETACRKKAEIVEADEREGGVRALLNLGHTFGHALEAAAGYDGDRLLHGEAVAIGMALAFRLSARTGICPATDARRVEDHLQAMDLPTRIGAIVPKLAASPDDLLTIMKRDKKATAQTIHFILLHGVGQAFIAKDVDSKDVLDILTE
ncbi:MAG: 3-dehydroquinate synthase [Alphaproteobacteria bacterium]|nr:3-dehydroquinate synthase [Alphaproteobacteria bacterium]